MEHGYLTFKRYVTTIIVLSVILLIVLISAPMIGSVKISWLRVFDQNIAYSENPDALILFEARLPRILLSAIIGGVLALAGAIFQSLLRNPLATPYILGVSSGSTFGVVLYIAYAGEINRWFGMELFGTITLLGIPMTFVVGFLGAFTAISFVYILSRTRGRLSTSTLLLAGVTVNFFFAAMILLVQYISDPAQSYRIIRWMMGGVDVDKTSFMLFITRVAPFILIGFVIAFSQARNLNLLSVNPDTARMLGVNVNRSRHLLFFTASLLTGSAVSLCGPIGFIGLIIPHILRLLIGSDNRLLLPASVLLGGAFLVICDTIARSIIPPDQIPVGVITATCGGPFFIWLLLRKKSQRLWFG